MRSAVRGLALLVLFACANGCYWRPGYYLNGGQYGYNPYPYAQPVYAQPQGVAAAPQVVQPQFVQPQVIAQPQAVYGNSCCNPCCQ